MSAHKKPFLVTATPFKGDKQRYPSVWRGFRRIGKGPYAHMAKYARRFSSCRAAARAAKRAHATGAPHVRVYFKASQLSSWGGRGPLKVKCPRKRK